MEAVRDRLQHIANKLEDLLDGWYSDPDLYDPLAEEDAIADCVVAVREILAEDENDWHPLDRWAPVNRASEGETHDAPKKTSAT